MAFAPPSHDLTAQKPKISDSPLSIISKFANVVSNHLETLTRSVGLQHLDVFIINGCIGVEYVNERNGLVVCSQQRHLVGLKPKCFRIHGQTSAEYGYVHAVRSEINSDCLGEVRKIAHQAKSLEISILDDNTDPGPLLAGFPVNFSHLSVATLCEKSDTLVRFTERVADFDGLRFLNFIGQLKGSIQSLDKMLLKLIELGRWEEIFVQVDGAIKEEVIFLERVVRWWKKSAPLKERELVVSFKCNLFEIDFIKNLPQGVIANEKVHESRRYFYMTHPKDHLKEARFSKDKEGMLYVQFT
ncbi:hypothetical protein QR680_004555 [Steinernema hermaphroditum]|uniref:Uncharacterized protein n=1 Tax=Steinernema hermaphroditum TaxID=289476 RepID=A0AA39HQI7_9BILA|nr:hypothetical protein QR680_004555 [Steinernema hermaphroditum]